VATTIFPEPSISTINASTVTVTSANTLYESSVSLPTGIYTITCASGTITNVDFLAGSSIITSAVTSSGTVQINLATAATKVRLYTNTGSNILVTFTKVANALTGTAISGTLDTITTTSTYTGTATNGAFAVLVGGGGNGQNGIYGGPGGGSGAICYGPVTLTGSMSVVIGSGTSAGGTSAGGTSTFAGWSAGGGSYGGSASPAPGGTATGAPNNQNGAQGNAGANGSSTTLVIPFVKNGTTGAGGGYGATTGGGDSGIGKGGNGGNGSGANGGAASGYGAGGGSCGGGGAGPGVSGAGTQGVLYVLRY